jgi:hypothetical protein
LALVVALDPNICFPQKGRNSDKSRLSIRPGNDHTDACLNQLPLRSLGGPAGMESKSMNQRGLGLGAVLSFALFIMGQNGALAQGTPEQQAACQPDVLRLCGNFIPDVDRIVACLKYNEPNLNPACHDVMFPYVPEEPKPKARPKAKPKPKPKKTG